MKKKITIAIDAMGGEKAPFKTIEGINASEGLSVLTRKYSLDLPICNKVFEIIQKKISPVEGVSQLLNRDQRNEFD